MEAASQLKQWVKGISIYKDKQNGPLAAFEKLVDSLNKPLEEITEHYTNFYYALVAKEPSGSWADYLFGYILTAENSFSFACAKGKFLDTESGVRLAVKSDLDYLQNLSNIRSGIIKKILFELFGQDNKEVMRLPDWMNDMTKYKIDGTWGDNLIRFADHYKDNGYGRFSVANVFYITHQGKISPVVNIEKQSEEELERLENTLTKLRHTFSTLQEGKSESIGFTGNNEQLSKGLIHLVQSAEYPSVKLVKIAQSTYAHFADVCEFLSQLPGMFVLFPDNLEKLIATNKNEMDTYIKRQSGLQVEKQNLALFASKESFSESEKEWFLDIVAI